MLWMILLTQISLKAQSNTNNNMAFKMKGFSGFKQKTKKGDASKAAYEEDVNDLLAWNSPENDPKRRAHEAMLAEHER